MSKPRQPEAFQSFEEGRRAWREGRFFDAHEHWEDLWRAESDGAVRDGLQGLIQLAASLHKAEEGEPAGHAKLWAKAGLRLQAAARRVPVLYGIDLQALLAMVPTEAPAPEARPALDAPRPEFGVVYLHGFGSSPDSPKGEAVRQAMVEAGVPCVAPALAEPDEFFDFTVSRSLGRARHGLFERTLLVGSSLGGWTGTLLAAEDRSVVELILLCPAFHFPDRWFGADRDHELEQWRRDGSYPFELGHPPQMQPLGVGFIDDALRHDSGVRPPVPTTIFHGRRDEVVPRHDVERAVRDVDHVELRMVDDDHGLRNHLELIARFARDRALALKGGD